MTHRFGPIALATSAAVLLWAQAAPVSAMDVPAAKAAVDRVLNADYPRLDALYKDIHSHPELGHQEVRTAAVLAKEMRAAGLEVTEHVGGTGLVAILRNGPGPTVMVRTELDALPMEEKTGLPYASTVKAMSGGKESFVAHACGHDIHMAVWVGTARALAANRDRWHGTVMFIGQPAEETFGGASGMIKDGLFTRFPKPNVGFALHSSSGAYNRVYWKPGVESSNADSFEITFHGKGGHGATPQVTIDPILMASRFVVDVQSVVSREKDPLQAGVITVGAIQGGTVGNIIPDTAVVRGTIRSFDRQTRITLLRGMERTARAGAEMSAAPQPDVSILSGAEAVVNSDAVTQSTVPVFKAAFGDNAVELTRPTTTSEDYSDYIEAGVPSLFFNIGVYDPARVDAAAAGGPALPSNHSPFYAPVPEPTIRTGVEAMSLAVMNAMTP
ncbi:MAG: amidohydrolase [Proteobacteria bacterium]|nr:amidohydrolase [Pseudomonadota bacterium]